MSSKFRQDYGMPLTNSICYNPVDKVMHFGTNFYNRVNYCNSTLQPTIPYTTTEIKEYSFFTQNTPWSNLFLYDKGMTLQYDLASIKNKYKFLFYHSASDNSLNFQIQVNERSYSYMQSLTTKQTMGVVWDLQNYVHIEVSTGMKGVRIRNTAGREILLDLEDLNKTSGKVVRLREFAISDQGVSKKILLFASEFYV